MYAYAAPNASTVNELTDRHEVDEALYIYLQRNSKVWLARFKIDGKWISRTTKQREKSKAITGAIRVKAECEIKQAHGIAIQTKAFKDVAQLAIERMEQQPSTSKGYTTLKDYRWVLQRYHVPYFARTHITSIDYSMLTEFDVWRAKELGRTPAQSTLKTHNAALQRVFDEAVIRKWMTPSQIPTLSVSGGVSAARRDYFTAYEVSKIRDAFPTWVEEGRTPQSRNIRELLFFYFNFAVHTGLRPGSEMDNLKWNDIQIEADHVVITVRKGKTTMHTGNRHVVGHSTVLDIILDMHSRSLDGVDTEHGVPNDWNPLVFRLPNGNTTDQLGRNFTVLLKRLGLELGSGGKRTLYSLRHTYITHLLLDKVSMSVIAKQCGTSTAMIEMHYSHITPLMYAKELAGSENAELTKLIRKYADLESS
jgi:integrase